MTPIMPICRILLVILFVSVSSLSYAQRQPKELDDRPKLVVGIVVDQMRYEYLPRFWSEFGDDGFKRMVNNGYSFTNNHFNYFPTKTGAGHAAVYTGTTPSVNGIVGNSWYERARKSGMYVVSDTTVETVGGNGDARSPANLLSTTVTDELKKSVNESKVVGISIKDRGAVLPAGHLADGAYWYDDHNGDFVSSTWYMDELPQWMNDFNNRDIPQEYSTKTWEPIKGMSAYSESNKDDTPYEGTFGGNDDPVFPHAMDGSLSRIKTSPFGNDLISELAKAAIKGEELGSDEITDFLAVSFSSTDYVGHHFGPNSIEMEDTYLRLDQSIADLLSYLDETVGKGDYIIFLTADHGAVDNPASLKARGLPGGYFDSGVALDELSSHLNDVYGENDWIERYTNQQVYLNRNVIEQEDVSLTEIQQETARFMRGYRGVATTNTAYNFESEEYTEGTQAMYQRGHYPNRSGDVYIQLAPGWLDQTNKIGTNHGSPYSYDTHVPLIFYGWNVPKGQDSRKTVIPQIAPTVSSMLQIQFPNGSDTNVLQFK